MSGRDWNNLFCDIKTYWNTEAIRHWREKALKQFIFNLPNVKNPMPLFHAFIQSDIFYLSQIISLVEIPPLACELRCAIWLKWYTITSSKEFARPRIV
ncbi:6783_t:CDS:2 [Funneliformis mosseae]|uniref:6783_t:CDS:1 n=1 Tax=Funneliformis mosseae TaxID=27381 RepID=A0A9N9DSF6_FUNMO|nr:6783_t:CDS:2 [Funneliformis mosseae]